MDDLERFVDAQDAHGSFDAAMAELRAGAKWGHWIWWVFPQLRGLGTSHHSTYYGIAGSREARVYLGHPVLGPRLRRAVEELMAHEGARASDLVGWDDVKLRSCLTLFATVDEADGLFARALARYFDGPDAVTLAMLAEPA